MSLAALRDGGIPVTLLFPPIASLSGVLFSLSTPGSGNKLDTLDL